MMPHPYLRQQLFFCNFLYSFQLKPTMSNSSLLLVLLLLFLSTVPLSLSHNITTILADRPEFSTFNHYLSATRLADDINRRRNITVLALDNPAMSPLLSRHFGLRTLKNVLSLHVLLDYFGAEELHQLKGGAALSSSTIFRSAGSAEGAAGAVNVSVRGDGKVTFCAEGSDETASFVKAVKEIPDSIAVLQISAPLSSEAAEALTPAPAPAPAPTPTPALAPAPVSVSAPVHVDIFGLMSKKGSGCKTFADLLTAGAGTGSAAKTFEDNAATGLSIFCPIDRAMHAFLPKFNNLTAAERTSALLYHGVPVYESMDTLRSTHNGLRVITLATSPKGARDDYILTVASAARGVVTLSTGVSNASVTGTLVDDDPLAVYTIDRVLEPAELFEMPEPAPAPAPAARAPEGPSSKKKKKQPEEVAVPTPAGPEPEPDDEKATDDEGASTSIRVRRWAVAVAAMAAVVLIT